MTIPSWPSGLPQILLRDGFSETSPDNRLRSEVDVGPARLRRRASRAPSALQGQIAISREDLETLLKPFIADDTAGGVLPFYFPSPADGSPLLCRFASELPSWTYAVPGFVKVSLQLEVMP